MTRRPPRLRARRSAARRGSAVVAGAVVAVLTLSGCLAAQIPDVAATDDAPDVVEGVADDLLPFYEQDVAWDACGDLECATVTAPLDWQDPDAGEIDLAVIRQPALEGNAQGSLLLNPGGPGGSGVSFLRDSAASILGSDVQDAYDVVGWDPRGVGESTAVTCLDAPAMDSFLYDIPDGARGSAEWDADVDARLTSFADACEENSDGILPFITTEQSSRDMDLLRAVLGERQLDYLGYSYGTFLGATYAKNFPDRVGRFVLDGAVDPSISGGEVGTEQAIGFEKSLRTYLQACLDGDAGEDCPFTGTVDDALGDLSALLASADATPLRASGDARRAGADTLVTAIITALYAQANWPYLTSALASAFQGDAATALYLADFYNGRDADGQYADNATEAFTAYNCVDYPVESDAERAAQAQTIAEEAPTIAPYWSETSACDHWSTPPTGERQAITADGAAPILVVGTTGDPATPYDWAVSLADQLSSGVLLTHEGEGHTAYGNGSGSCVDDTVEAYLLDGTVPEDGRVCS